MSRKLIKSTAIVSFMTFLSRILGLIRDVVVARFFGAGAGTDAFFVAFKIPNFFRRLTAEASFAYAFVPVLTEYKTKRDHAAVQELVDRVAGAMASVLFLMTLIGVVASPVLIGIFAPAWIHQPQKFDLASTMLMLTFPYLFFISLTALAGGILNAYNKFAVPAFTPVLLNLSLIGAAVGLSPHMPKPALSLAVGVFLAGVVQLAFQVPYLVKIKLLPKPRWYRRRAGHQGPLHRLAAAAGLCFSYYKEKNRLAASADHSGLDRLASRLAAALGSLLFLLSLVMLVLIPLGYVVFGTAWLQSAQPLGWLPVAVVTCLPWLVLLGLGLLTGLVQRRLRRFFWPVMFPALLYSLLLGYVIWLAPQVKSSYWVLFTGVFAALLIGLGSQVPGLMKQGVLPKPEHEGFRRILKLMVPTLFSSSAMQISLLIDTWLASALITGSVSWLYFSDRLVEFPLGVFGIAIATVILPNLSKSHAQQSHENFQHTLDWAIRWVMMIGIPSTVGLFVLSGPLITTIFYRGAFTAEHVTMTTWALMAYSIGLMGFILVKVLSPGFYSRQDSKTPMIAAFWALGIKVLLSLLFLYLLIFVFEVKAAHVGLALATALGATINASLLYLILRRREIYRISRAALVDALRIALSAALMGVFIYSMSPPVEAWLKMGLWTRILELSLLVFPAIVLFFVAVVVLGARPWRWKSGMH